MLKASGAIAHCGTGDAYGKVKDRASDGAGGRYGTRASPAQFCPMSEEIIPPVVSQTTQLH